MATPAAVTLEVFKDHLNIPAGNTQDDAEVTRTLIAATSAAEGRGRVGPIIARAFDHRAASTGGVVVLPKRPLVSIDAVVGTRGGQSLVAADLGVDKLAGIVEYRDGRGIPSGAFDFTYTAGWFTSVAEVDEDVALAVCIIGKHLWETQRGRQSRPGILGNTSTAQADPDRVPLGYALPNRAQQLLTPYVSALGVA